MPPSRDTAGRRRALPPAAGPRRSRRIAPLPRDLVTASSTLRTPRTRHCCIVVILPAARAARENEGREKPASRSCAACERSGGTLARGAVQPRLNPQCSCVLPCAASPSAPSCHRRPELGKLGAALRRRTGPRPFATCRPRWAMDSVAGGCPRNRRSVRLGLFAAAMSAQVLLRSGLAPHQGIDTPGAAAGECDIEKDEAIQNGGVAAVEDGKKPPGAWLMK